MRMIRMLKLGALLITLATLGSAGVVNFDLGAPCLFRETTRLTEAYAGLGVHFAGPGGNSGGAILDQCSNFDGMNARSGVDFLAFNNTALLSDGGIPTGP